MSSASTSRQAWANPSESTRCGHKGPELCGTHCRPPHLGVRQCHRRWQRWLVCGRHRVAHRRQWAAYSAPNLLSGMYPAAAKRSALAREPGAVVGSGRGCRMHVSHPGARRPSSASVAGGSLRLLARLLQPPFRGCWPRVFRPLGATARVMGSSQERLLVAILRVQAVSFV